MEKSKDLWTPTFCQVCLEGPCLVRVHTVDGVAVNIEGNRDVEGFAEFSKNRGSTCSKPFGMIQKLYNPHRVKAPLKRTNPEKGPNVDPKWIEISWDEALSIVAEKLKEIRAKDPRRLCVTFGPQLISHSGTWYAFLNAFGEVQDLGGGASLRCRMAEHIFGNLIHGAYRCLPDLTYCNYLINLGDNTLVSGGAPENMLYSAALARGMKAVVIDPVLTPTAAKADQWLPIKPGTDSAFLLALIHVILHELNKYDVEFLKTLTNSPYLVSNSGYFLRDKSDNKVMVWDPIDIKAKPFDDASIKDFALEGTYLVDGIEVRPAFQVLKDHIKKNTPEWAYGITEINPYAIRKIAKDFVDNAMIGSTIRIQGLTLPFRPAAIRLGRGISGAMHSYQCILATHILEALIGSIEVVGGHGGGMKETQGHWRGIKPGADGMLKFDSFPFTWPPISYDGVETLLPYAKIYEGIHMRHLAYRNLVEPAKNFPIPARPEALIRFRSNPIMSIGEPDTVVRVLASIPFIVSIAYVMDEMTEFADIVLPEHLELERFELTISAPPRAARKHREVLLKQPTVLPLYNTMEISDILTELADRIGILREYNGAVNARLCLAKQYMLDPGTKYNWVDIVDKQCKSVTSGAHDLQWFKKNGAILKPVRIEDQYDVHLKMIATKMRYPIPYMEHVKKTGEELARNLARVGIDWWPTFEYVALPIYVPPILEDVPSEYDFYVTVARIPQFAYGSSVTIPWMLELADHLRRHQCILMNAESAKVRGIKDGDEVWVESQVGKVKRNVKLCEGIRPDTLVIAGQFGQWTTPVARDTGWVSEVILTPIKHSWTDPVVGCMQGNLIKAKVYKAQGS